MAKSLGPLIAQTLKDNLHLFFTCDLTEWLVKMLKILTTHIPVLLGLIQGQITIDDGFPRSYDSSDGLLKMLFVTLTGQLYIPPGALDSPLSNSPTRSHESVSFKYFDI